MTPRIFTIFAISLCMSSFKTNAQSADSLRVREFVVTDTLGGNNHHKAQIDTLAWLEGKSIVDQKAMAIIDGNKQFLPNSKKAILYAIIPGGGQFYNRKYWKLPIVYGGFIGLTYAISWNGKYYGDYKDAYAAIMSEDRFQAGVVEKWTPFLRPGINPSELSETQIATLQNSFKRSKDSYRRYRDLSIIGMVALYALSIIDAYVDAELFDFDISPDLSLRVEPAKISNSSLRIDNTIGIQCSLRF